tara:strand:- start:1828 stop:2061 length:234 start_codon:yes stop_codon:yes gene_type:complete
MSNFKQQPVGRAVMYLGTLNRERLGDLNRAARYVPTLVQAVADRVWTGEQLGHNSFTDEDVDILLRFADHMNTEQAQ